MILVAYGTRPEFIKITPLLKAMNKANIVYKTLFTGQHSTMLQNDADFDLYNSSVNQNRLNAIIDDCVSKSDIFKDMSYVMVQGDTSSAFGIALSAFHNQIKIIHLEAGLRTYDISSPYPEEANRRFISVISDIHFCPTQLNCDNLVKENIYGDKYVVGNSGLDNLIDWKSKCEYTNVILITLHRRENHRLIPLWFKEINNLAKLYKRFKFIFPMHPNPNVQKHIDILDRISVVDPLPYTEMLSLLSKASLVITDSGGLQEECSFLNKKCLVCRRNTERPESLYQSSFLVSEPAKLVDTFIAHIQSPAIYYSCPFGDGHTSLRIVSKLEKYI